MGRYKIYYNINGGNLKYNLTYGELTRDGLLNLFKDVDTNNKTFYDLGSGDGNVLIYASEEFPNLKKIVGIEINKNRHIKAEKIIKEKNKSDKIKVFNDDILSKKYNYKDADLIYISNLCFSPEVNQAISEKLRSELKKGTIVFSSKKLDFDLSEASNTNVKQTWHNSSSIFINKIK